MHFLLTGHTGFKGSWLSLLLHERGHTVSGLALAPASDGLFERAEVREVIAEDMRVDIRDATATASAVARAEPDVVIHLAAQALVRESYRTPRETFETNVMGTLNVLAAVQEVPSVRAHVVVTTDKVYRNVGKRTGYSEADPLGGDDPYSSSKAMADILARSWATSFPGPPTAVARAGNVIGGGDISADRLIPDLIKGFESGKATRIRFPDAVRPWQHVLDCVNGYLVLVDALLEGRGAGEWNFGPGAKSFVPVSEVADLAAKAWGQGATWLTEDGDHPHEASLLALDASKAETELRWGNRLSFEDSVRWAVEWYRATPPADARDISLRQIRKFEALK